MRIFLLALLCTYSASIRLVWSYVGMIACTLKPCSLVILRPDLKMPSLESLKQQWVVGVCLCVVCIPKYV